MEKEPKMVRDGLASGSRQLWGVVHGHPLSMNSAVPRGDLNGAEELRLGKQRYVCKGRFLMEDHL